MKYLFIFLAILFASCKSKTDLLVGKDWVISYYSISVGGSRSEFNKRYNFSDSALLLRFYKNNSIDILIKGETLHLGIWKKEGDKLIVSSGKQATYKIYDETETELSMSKIDSENNAIFVMSFATKQAQWIQPNPSYGDMKDTANFKGIGIDINKVHFP